MIFSYRIIIQNIMLSILETKDLCQNICIENKSFFIEFFIVCEHEDEICIEKNQVSHYKNSFDKQIGIKVITSSGMGFYFTTGFDEVEIRKGVNIAVMNSYAQSKFSKFCDKANVSNIDFNNMLVNYNNETHLEELENYSTLILSYIKKKNLNIENLKVIKNTKYEIFVDSNKTISVDYRDVTVVDGTCFIKSKNYISPLHIIYDGGLNLNINRIFSQIDDIVRMEEAKVKFLGNINHENITIILSPYAFFQLIIEPIITNIKGHDIINKTSLISKTDLNKKIFSDKLTIIDDNTNKHFSNYRNFDREGQRMKKKYLVRNGVVKNFLLDSNSAAELQILSTNRAGGSADENGIIEYTNLLVKEGVEEIRSILMRLDEALLIERFSGKIDRNTGVFTGNVRAGYYYEKGINKGAMDECIITGNSFEVAREIHELSKNRKTYGNMKLPYALCSKIKLI